MFYNFQIVINVGGIRHETLVSTLLAKAGTRLHHLAKHHVRGTAREYFFDRHPGVFSTVMDYYRGGEFPLLSVQLITFCDLPSSFAVSVYNISDKVHSTLLRS